MAQVQKNFQIHYGKIVNDYVVSHLVNKEQYIILSKHYHVQFSY